MKSDLIECGRTIAEYLEGKSIPMLSHDNGKYYFSYTELTKELLLQIPLEVKVKRYFLGEEDYKIKHV